MSYDAKVILYEASFIHVCIYTLIPYTFTEYCLKTKVGDQNSNIEKALTPEMQEANVAIMAPKVDFLFPGVPSGDITSCDRIRFFQ